VKGYLDDDSADKSMVRDVLDALQSGEWFQASCRMGVGILEYIE
jgi:hypothetical protein